MRIASRGKKNWLATSEYCNGLFTSTFETLNVSKSFISVLGADLPVHN